MVNEEVACKPVTSNMPAPPDIPPRENMVNTAVNFLRSPKVQNSPAAQKEAFLIKKGLTDKEIDLAFKRSGVSDIALTSPLPGPVIVRHPGAYEVYNPSFWSQFNRLGSTIIIIGVALYGLHRFYKLYIEPWLFGNQKQEDRLTQLEEQLLEVNRTLSQLRKVIGSVEEALVLQNDQRKHNVEFEQSVGPSFFLELKTDIATVKSLLLNRHQFPEIPKLSPTIPSWQLISSAGEKMTDVTLDDSLSEKENEDSNTSNESSKKDDPKEEFEDSKANPPEEEQETEVKTVE